MLGPSIGFAAASDPDARILILGSLPGAMSLKAREYYATPQNAFWRIMGALFAAGPELAYPKRIETLNRAGVALWDVCASAHRIGSLDSAIKDHAANDFEAFFATHPRISLVCFNGQKAAALYRKSVHGKLSAALQSVPMTILPSTSPAHAGVPYEEKLRQWSVLREAMTTHKGSAPGGERSSTTASS